MRFENQSIDCFYILCIIYTLRRSCPSVTSISQTTWVKFGDLH